MSDDAGVPPTGAGVPPSGAGLPPTRLERWTTRVGLLESCLKCLAILVGGVWAVIHFWDFETPELRHRADLKGRIEWHTPSMEASNSDHCVGWFHVSFRNIGKRPIRLTELKFSIWEIELGDAKSPIAYVDVVNMAGKKKIGGDYDIGPTNKAKNSPADSKKAIIEIEYPPGVSDEVGLMVHAKRAPGKLLLFMAEGSSLVEGLIFDSAPRPWYYHEVAEVCRDEDSATKKPKG